MAQEKPSNLTTTAAAGRIHILQMGLLADLENCHFTDVKFVVGPDGKEEVFYAHRLVLATVNCAFQNILKDVQLPMIIRLPDVPPAGFANFIRYFYGDSAFLSDDLLTLCSMFLASKKFLVSDLTVIIKYKIRSILPFENIIRIFKVAVELKLSKITAECLKIISTNFSDFLLTEELLSAPLEVVEPILNLWRDHVPEYQLWALFTFLEWTERHECPDDIKRRVLTSLDAGSIQPVETELYLRMKIKNIPDYAYGIFTKLMYSKKFNSIKDFLSKESAQAVPEDTAISSDFVNKKEEPNLETEKERCDQRWKQRWQNILFN